jgi:hypothetical protein
MLRFMSPGKLLMVLALLAAVFVSAAIFIVGMAGFYCVVGIFQYVLNVLYDLWNCFN